MSFFNPVMPLEAVVVAERIVVPLKFMITVAQMVCKRASGMELWQRLQLSVTSEQ